MSLYNSATTVREVHLMSAAGARGRRSALMTLARVQKGDKTLCREHVKFARRWNHEMLRYLQQARNA